jgi:hypothetical protein
MEEPMKKIIIAILVSVVFTQSSLFSQQTINASGGTIHGDGGSISFSVGELTTASITSQSGSVTPGLFSSIEVSVLSTRPEVADLLIFPNPTSDKIQIDFGESAPAEGMKFQLFDANGRSLRAGKLVTQKTYIDLLNLPSNLYFLYIQDQNRILKMIKIVKSN